MTRRTSGVTSVLDLWTVFSYTYPRTDRAAATSDAECIRQVENAGEPDEYLLPRDTGSGFLWRANTFAKYLERDGGVYVELDNVGLSRGFPPLLAWLVRPIARDLGRSSVEQKLMLLRDALHRKGGEHVADVATTPRLPDYWCTR